MTTFEQYSFFSPFIFFVIFFFVFFFWILFLYLLQDIKTIKRLSLTSSYVLFIWCLVFWITFMASGEVVYGLSLPWLDFFNVPYAIIIDSISLLFLALTFFVIPLCFLGSWNNIAKDNKFFFLLICLLEFLLFQVFCVSDLLLFYIFFESSLIPIYFIVGIWGSRSRKIHAANMLFLYTFSGSLFFLIAIMYLLSTLKTSELFFLMKYSLLLDNFSQYYLWCSFFIAFAIKIPMFPFHLWLPEAHVEAPTVGSIILAAVLLKLGSYGMLRFLLPLFPEATIFFRPLVFLLSILGVIVASFVCLRQNDLKKIIAYSSIAHMNLIILGLFSDNHIALVGSYYMMLSHGITSTTLFFLIGVLYDRYHTRLVKYYKALATFMPLFATFLLFFSFANVSLPLTSGFVGEILIFIGLFHVSPFISILSGFGVILGAAYSIWLFNRLAYGMPESFSFSSYGDINRREFFVIEVLAAICLWMGIAPSYLLSASDVCFLFWFS